MFAITEIYEKIHTDTHTTKHIDYTDTHTLTHARIKQSNHYRLWRFWWNELPAGSHRFSHFSHGGINICTYSSNAFSQNREESLAIQRNFCAFSEVQRCQEKKNLLNSLNLYYFFFLFFYNTPKTCLAFAFTCT